MNGKMKASASLLSLPAELREIIFKEAFSALPMFPIHFWKIVLPSISFAEYQPSSEAFKSLPRTLYTNQQRQAEALAFLPGVCFANRQLQAEALAQWFCCTPFVVDTADARSMLFQEFCEKYDYFKYIRCLIFDDAQLRYSREGTAYWPNPRVPTAHDLVNKCSGVRELTFKMPASVLGNTSSRLGPSRFVESIIRNFGFGPIFDLPRLICLNINIQREYSMEEAWVSRMAEPLLAWFKQEFKNRGMTTSVQAKVTTASTSIGHFSHGFMF
jgi:hypothetical protein